MLTDTKKSMNTLQNKKAIITGDGRSLGKTTVLSFAKESINIQRQMIHFSFMLP